MANLGGDLGELATALARRVLAKQLPKMTDEERTLLTGAEKPKPRTFYEIDGIEARNLKPIPGEEFGTKYHGYPDYLKLQRDPYAGLVSSGKELPASASYADNEADIINNMNDLFNNAVARVQAKKRLTTFEPNVRVKDRKKQADKFAADAQQQTKHDTYQKQEEATWNQETESYERGAGKYNLEDNQIRARTGNPDEHARSKQAAFAGKPASLEEVLLNMRAGSHKLPEGKASGTDILAEQYFLQGGAEGVPPMHLENTPLSQELADQRENVSLLTALRKRLERGQAPYSKGQKYDPAPMSTPERRAAMLAKRNWQPDDTKAKPGLDRRKEDKLSLENREANQEQLNLLDVWIRREQAKVEQLEKALMDAKE